MAQIYGLLQVIGKSASKHTLYRASPSSLKELLKKIGNLKITFIIGVFD